MDRKLPVKIKRIELDGDYQDWWLEIQTNPPSGALMDSIEALENVGKDVKLSVAMPPVYSLLQLVILKWNFVDVKGRDLSINIDSFKKLPIDLIMQLALKTQEVLIALPLAPKPS